MKDERKKRTRFINPEGMHSNPAFSQLAVSEGASKTVYIGGQNAVDVDGRIIGENDIAVQAEQILKNLGIALDAGGAGFGDIVKWRVYVVQGQNPQPAFQVFQRALAELESPPLITMAFVPGLANPGFLMEVEATAIVY